MINFAFYGRVSTEDQQDPESSRGWQLTRSRALIESRGGVVVAEFFDVDKSRSIPWQRRPEATALLAELKNPGRGFDAVVIGEPHRAFYGNQYGLTFPIFDHYGVPLWVPEVGGPIDPANEAHDLVMSVFGGMSKGERNRVKIRVRTAMAAQAQIEGRFLGGRPPYGYVIVDAGPHPNPSKAADGKRLHKLALDPEAAAVVIRIFAEFLAGSGIFAIAENLTRDGIPSPSAHDPARNAHRSGIAWAKGAVRAILTNPRYTGYQVWNRQRTDEVLLDVENVALGHTAKMRWNPADKWVFSEQIAHPPIIGTDDFARLCKPAQMTMKTELNPHEAVPDGWSPGQISSRAFLAWAAEPATAPPAIHGARDAQLAMLAEPARVPACAVSRSVEPVGWAKQIELIRHGAPHSGLHPDARSCRIEHVAYKRHSYVRLNFHRSPITIYGLPPCMQAKRTRMPLRPGFLSWMLESRHANLL
jgi:DNA invertase Pin-like site-specific DNA recombinase